MNSPTEGEGGGADAVRRTALRLLMRREHSPVELRQKLLRRGYVPDVVVQVLAELGCEGLLSEQRYAEAYVHSRVQRGYGPAAIRRDLKTRGVADEVIATHLESDEAQWLARIDTVRRKRFGSALPAEARERARQARFLQQRGFTAGQIRKVLGGWLPDD